MTTVAPYQPKIHGLQYVPVATSVFSRMPAAVVLSTWSLEGAQPLLMTYVRAVQYRAKMLVHGQEITVISAKAAIEIAAKMTAHIGNKCPEQEQNVTA